MSRPTSGPVLFAYDGSELAAHTIAVAGAQLAPGRDAVVACVWQPVEVGFTPAADEHLDANQPTAVRAAAERTAAHGADLARAAGFAARPLAVEATSPGDGILAAAEQVWADLIVVGARHHGALAARVLSHVGQTVLAHTSRTVLVVHCEDPADADTIG